MLTKNRQLKCRKNEAFSPLLLQQLNYAKMFQRQEELAESKIMCINWRLHVVRVNGSQQKSLDIKIDNGLLFIIGGHIFSFFFALFIKSFPSRCFSFARDQPISVHYNILEINRLLRSKGIGTLKRRWGMLAGTYSAFNWSWMEEEREFLLKMMMMASLSTRLSLQYIHFLLCQRC